MHPVQEYVNTLGIDCSIQRLTEYIFYEFERNNACQQQNNDFIPSVDLSICHPPHTPHTPHTRLSKVL